MANNQAKMNREQKEEFKNQMRDIALDFIEGDWEAERIDNLKDLLATLSDTFGAMTPCALLASLYLAKYSRNKFKKCLTISFERGNIISDSKGCAVLQDITRLVSCRDCTNAIQKEMIYLWQNMELIGKCLNY